MWEKVLFIVQNKKIRYLIMCMKHIFFTLIERNWSGGIKSYLNTLIKHISVRLNVF